MDAGDGIIVIELTATEGSDPDETLTLFAEATAARSITTLREWSPLQAAYVVVHDPELQAFEVAENIPGVRIQGAAQLDLGNDSSLDLESIRALLPTELEQTISLPPLADPAASIPPPSPPYVICPNCALRVHPPPEHPPPASSSSSEMAKSR